MLILITGSCVLLSLGVIGTYIGKIYDEVKYKNYSFDIHDLYYLDSYNKFTIGEFADIIIKHILDFISQNNHK